MTKEEEQGATLLKVAFYGAVALIFKEAVEALLAEARNHPDLEKGGKLNLSQASDEVIYPTRP